MPLPVEAVEVQTSPSIFHRVILDKVIVSSASLIGSPTTRLCLWVLEGHEWSEYVYTLPENPPFDLDNVSIVGMTATGEIVLSEKYTSERFYVFYFNPERKTLQRVEILGLENRCEVNAYVDHIEDLNLNDAKYIKSKPRPKPQKRDLCDSAPSVKSEEQAIDKPLALAILFMFMS
ncbi:unnamed protein product [Microthlaspi erraticum]|uniref:F-box associated beta-propeller type 3 domain-containing protein n=1 Tax=Microthlaspi erraticum TaxID=1685480 RepID=A0A6D2LMN3_9BRAS|nr:unnamed protein product [Microthlaspi erraticum]CAA7061335.1 unnamed protein product [Microthlaspi erraticum]